MRNYIILNGQNSNSISGLLIQSLAPISKPLMRTEIEEIDGRDGDITTKLGYSAYDKQITIGLYGNYDINEVIAYFNSEGTVIFSNEPDKYYNYQIAAQIDFERLVRYKTATVTMHCQPFKYSATEGTEIFGASSNLVTIPNFSRTTNGITVTVSDGLMTVSGKSSAATEFYVPIDTLSLAAGSYTMTAVGSGTAPEACSLRVIYDSPSSANSFGGGYVTLKNNTDVSLSATLTATKTYNYVYLYIAANKSMNFTLNLQIVDQTQAVVSGEGTELVLENTAEAPFSQFDLKGNTSQQTYSGKNLCNYTDAAYPVSKNGLVATLNSDGSITVTGTPNANYVIFVSQNMIDILEDGATYTISSDSYSADFYIDVVATRVGGGNSYPANTRSGSASFTVNKSTFSGYTINIQTFTTASWGASSKTITRRFQLEKSSSASSFEPYVGGIPAPNPDYPQAVKTVTGENVVKISDGQGNEQSYEVNLGKNLFDGETINAWLRENGTEVSSAGDRTSANYISVSPNTAYTIHGTNSTYLKFTQFDSSKTSVSQQTTTAETSLTVTTGATTAYVRIGWGNAANASNVQLEKGSTATSYAAYFTPIELCKIGTYQDYIYKSDGKWYVHKETNKIVLTGAESENWSSGNMQNVVRYNKEVPDSITAQGTAWVVQPTYCDSFRNISAGNNWNTAVGDSNYALVNATKIYRFTKGEAIGSGASTDAWKAWLASNPITLYYALATPTDTEITNQALIEQLDDIYYHAHAYKERTHVNSTYASGNVPHIIAAAVTANMGDITVTNSGNYISKPTMTIFGSGDIGVYLNGIQLFQIALGDTEYITIDCAAMEAYKDTLETLQNRLVTGDYSNFVLNPGDNTISFSGSVTKFEISNYSRWL